MVVDDVMVDYRTVMVGCDVGTMVDHRSTVVWVVAAHPSCVAVSYDEDNEEEEDDDVLVDIHDVDAVVERVQTQYHPILDMDIPPQHVNPVVMDCAMPHHVMRVDTGWMWNIHGDHENSRDGNDSNAMSLETHRMIHNYQNYSVLRQQLVMEHMVVPTIRIDYHILMDKYRVEADHS
jgi:hypothetical protein